MHVRARAQSGRENDRRARVRESGDQENDLELSQGNENRMDNFEEESTFLLQEVQCNLTLLRLSQD
jgi:hypothetical protein